MMHFAYRVGVRYFSNYDNNEWTLTIYLLKVTFPSLSRNINSHTFARTHDEYVFYHASSVDLKRWWSAIAENAQTGQTICISNASKRVFLQSNLQIARRACAYAHYKSHERVSIYREQAFPHARLSLAIPH